MSGVGSAEMLRALSGSVRERTWANARYRFVSVDKKLRATESLVKVFLSCSCSFSQAASLLTLLKVGQ